MRAFIRHPVSIPIELSTAGAGAQRELSQDVGLGGLALEWPEALEPGAAVQIHIGIVRPPFSANGTVAWNRPMGDRHLLGIRFLDQDDAYRVRMVEQVCHIEHYRQEILREQGRELSEDEAAREWMEIYARDFPGS